MQYVQTPNGNILYIQFTEELCPKCFQEPHFLIFCKISMACIYLNKFYHSTHKKDIETIWIVISFCKSLTPIIKALTPELVMAILHL